MGYLYCSSQCSAFRANPEWEHLVDECAAEVLCRLSWFEDDLAPS